MIEWHDELNFKHEIKQSRENLFFKYMILIKWYQNSTRLNNLIYSTKCFDFSNSNYLFSDCGWWDYFFSSRVDNSHEFQKCWRKMFWKDKHGFYMSTWRTHEGDSLFPFWENVSQWCFLKYNLTHFRRLLMSRSDASSYFFDMAWRAFSRPGGRGWKVSNHFFYGRKESF